MTELDFHVPPISDQRQYSIGLDFAVTHNVYRAMIDGEQQALLAEFTESRNADELPSEFNQAFKQFCVARGWSDPEDPDYFVVSMAQTELWTQFREEIEQGRWSEPDNLREAWKDFLAKHGKVIATGFFE
jgi:hypothetical protein